VFFETFVLPFRIYILSSPRASHQGLRAPVFVETFVLPFRISASGFFHKLKKHGPIRDPMAR